MTNKTNRTTGETIRLTDALSFTVGQLTRVPDCYGGGLGVISDAGYNSLTRRWYLLVIQLGTERVCTVRPDQVSL